MEKKAAAFPGRDTPAFIEAMREAYACTPARNVMEACFNSPNLSIHLAGSLLNTGGIERDPAFRMYAQGLTPGVLALSLIHISGMSIVIPRGVRHYNENTSGADAVLISIFNPALR